MGSGVSGVSPPPLTLRFLKRKLAVVSLVGGGWTGFKSGMGSSWLRLGPLSGDGVQPHAAWESNTNCFPLLSLQEDRVSPPLGWLRLRPPEQHTVRGRTQGLFEI